MSDQRYLGLHDGNDAGVCLLDDSGRPIFAANEERFCRKKLYVGFPSKALRFFSSSIPKDSSLQVLVAGKGFFGTNFHRDFFRQSYRLSFFRHLFFFLRVFRKIIYFYESIIYRFHSRFTKRCLKNFGLKADDYVDHHLAHAASAYYPSGFQSALIITMDGYGDGVAASVSIGSANSITRIKSFGWGASVAQAYSRITQYYGFVPHKHEGKITGLAAYGDASRCYSIFEKLIRFSAGKVSSHPLFCVGFDKKGMDRLFASYDREDVAAALQQRCEDVVMDFVSYWVKKTGQDHVCLAGGVFANVKINQAIASLSCVKQIFIFPHMGDGGLGFGAALTHIKPKPYVLSDVYLGPEYSDKHILDCLSQNRDIEYEKHDNIEKAIAQLLSQGKVLARFSGRMEYGPRALGNRSILFQTSDKTVNDWLNKKLKRTEFMPFAPSTLDEDFDSCYKNTDKSILTSKFMNISYECTDFMKNMSPAVVHIDGTARPQRVCARDNPSYHKILKEYKKITGVPSLLNTSFNMHEEPIVCTPKEALRAFLSSGLDYLAIGDYLVHRIN